MSAVYRRDRELVCLSRYAADRFAVASGSLRCFLLLQLNASGQVTLQDSLFLFTYDGAVLTSLQVTSAA